MIRQCVHGELVCGPIGALVDEVLADLGCDTVAQLTLLNKVDVADDMAMVEMLTCHRPDSLSISALTGEGIDRLITEVRGRSRGDTIEVTVRIPHTEGKLLAELGTRGFVRDRRFLAEGVELDLRISRTQLSQFAGRYKCLTVLGDNPPTSGDTDPDQPE